MLEPQKDESPIIEWLTIADIEKLRKKSEVFNSTFDICNWVFDKYM